MGYPDLKPTVQAGWEALLEVEAELKEARTTRDEYAKELANLPITHLDAYLYNTVNSELPSNMHLRVKNAEYYGAGYVFTLNKVDIKHGTAEARHLQSILDHYVETFDWALWIHSPFKGDKPAVKTPTRF